MNAATQKIKARKNQKLKKRIRQKSRKVKLKDVIKDVVKLIESLPERLSNLSKKNPEEARRIVFTVLLKFLENRQKRGEDI